MRTIGWYVFLLCLVLTGVIVQNSIFAPSVFRFFDVLTVVTLWLAISGRLIDAWLFLFVASGIVDVLLGWTIPVHLIGGTLGLASFLLLRRRVFSSQTPFSVSVNAMIAVALSTLLSHVAVGLSWITGLDQGLRFDNFWSFMVARIVFVGVAISMISASRRRQLSRLQRFS